MKIERDSNVTFLSSSSFTAHICSSVSWTNWTFFFLFQNTAIDLHFLGSSIRPVISSHCLLVCAFLYNVAFSLVLPFLSYYLFFVAWIFIFISLQECLYSCLFLPAKKKKILFLFQWLNVVGCYSLSETG